jgi:transcriptional regulator with XRE-family HTH domain
MTAVIAPSLLDPVRELLGLSDAELARLFGVRRQAVSQWRERGIPGARQEKASALASIADLLAHQLKPERIPGIVRRPARAYGGLSMLEMISADRHPELLEKIRASFDWAGTS